MYIMNSIKTVSLVLLDMSTLTIDITLAINIIIYNIPSAFYTLRSTDSQVRYCVCTIPNHVMSIFRLGYFAVIKLCTKRLKYKTTPLCN